MTQSTCFVTLCKILIRAPLWKTPRGGGGDSQCKLLHRRAAQVWMTQRYLWPSIPPQLNSFFGMCLQSHTHYRPIIQENSWGEKKSILGARYEILLSLPVAKGHQGPEEPRARIRLKGLRRRSGGRRRRGKEKECKPVVLPLAEASPWTGEFHKMCFLKSSLKHCNALCRYPHN